MKSKLDKEKRKKEKLRLQKRANDIHTINKFVTDSDKTLGVLHALPVKAKQDITLNVAEITKFCSLYAKDTQLLILQSNLEISKLSLEKEELLFKSSHITGNIFQHIARKISISVNSAKNNRNMVASQKLLSQYEQEAQILSDALKICSEFGRRLSFYLSFE